MNDKVFPFTAIVGQQPLKLALTLCAVDPGIGGVLLSGARGTAKSTIARALLELMPGADRGSFITLPLGASEEHITGTLNLEKVLADGSVDFAPGLLHRAHKGVLYVDEVNLLADHLVDLLLDVAASGVNTIERDGISQRHPAEFVLLGTMNPEEGELRPQLLDRYGMFVEVDDSYSVQQRVEIVRARLEYDADPWRFNRSYDPQQAQLIQACNVARKRLSSVSLSEELLVEIAGRCVREAAEGVRADIVIHRAARAHAALAGRGEVTVDDVDAVAEFALAHRRREPVQTTSQSSSHSPRESSSDESRQPESGDWGAMPPVRIGTGELRRLDGEKDSAPGPAKKKMR